MWDGRLGHWVNGLQFQKGLKLFVRGPKSFFFFLEINLLREKRNLGQGGRAPTCVCPWPYETNRKTKQNTINNNSAIQKPNGKKP